MKLHLTLAVLFALFLPAPVGVTWGQQATIPPIPTPSVAPVSVPEIPVEDRLLIREAQVRLAQANINLLNSQIELQRQETEFSRMLESIKIKHDCRDCTVSADLKFTRPPTPAAPSASPSAAVPAAKPAGSAPPTGTTAAPVGNPKGEKQ